MISYLKCFSTKPKNSVQVCATRLYHDNDEEADGKMYYRKKCVGTQQKDDKDQEDEQDDLFEQTLAVQKWEWCDKFLVQAGTERARCN